MTRDRHTLHPLALALVALLAAGEAAAKGPTPKAAALDPSLEMADVVRHLEAPGSIQWFPVASILASRETSCIDGRSSNAVVGSPGGDTGDLLLTLAAWEEASGVRLPPHDAARLFDAYLASFGVFYLHTDDHALEALGETLRADPRLAHHRDRLADTRSTFEFIVAPELAADREAEAIVDTALTDPKHIGCGHLKLMRTHPEAYGVAPHLFDALYRAIFRVARRRPGLIDLTRLEGAHRERAVVIVRVPNEIHAHTLVPGVVPALGGVDERDGGEIHELFVHHPSVAAFMRAENAWFTLDETARIGYRRIPFAALTEALDALAERQIRATLAALAGLHPVFTADLARDADGATHVRVRHLPSPSKDDLTH